MPLVTFSIEAIYSLNLSADQNPSISWMKTNLPTTKENATTVLIVDIDENQFPNETRYEFSPFTIVFKTLNPQSLYIPLVCYRDRAGTTSPRFHLYDLSSHAPILSVEHSTSGSWQALGPFSVFPENADLARIRFNMQPSKGKLYKLNVGIWDTETNKRVDCDPMVGNDPPQ